MGKRESTGSGKTSVNTCEGPRYVLGREKPARTESGRWKNIVKPMSVSEKDGRVGRLSFNIIDCCREK